MVQLPTGITTDALSSALDKLAIRHDILRTTFAIADINDNIWQQRYTDTLTCRDIVEIAAGAFDSKQLNQHLTQVQNQFSLQDNYLWQAAHLTGFEDGRSRLFMALHHLIVDAVSWRILAEDLQLLLSAHDSGSGFGSVLPAKTSSYRQWTAALKNYAHEHQHEAEYWQNVTADHQVLSDHFEVCAFSEAQTHSLMFSKALTTQLLQQANKGFNTDINDLLLAALARALSGTFDSEVNHITLEGHGREPIAANLDVSLVHQHVSGAPGAQCCPWSKLGGANHH